MRLAVKLPCNGRTIDHFHKIRPTGAEVLSTEHRRRLQITEAGNMSTEGKCPVVGENHGQESVLARVNRDWWPNQLNLHALPQNSPVSSPLGNTFNYAKEFESLDLDAVIK